MPQADGFTKPEPQPPPAQNPDIARPLDIEAAAPEKKDLYEPLLDVHDRIQAGEDPNDIKIQTHATESELAADAPTEEEEEEPVEAPTEEERKEFLRCVFADKPYEKTYTAFGVAHFTFRDRSTKATEEMYTTLQGRALKTDEEWALWLERYQLALQLMSYKHEDQTIVAFMQLPVKVPEGAAPIDFTEELESRVHDLMGRHKALYQAMMEANRKFEAHMAYLTDKAFDSDFWKPGGVDSSPTPTAQARSTLVPTTGATPTGRLKRA